MNKLNARQEIFIQEIAKGSTQHDAYKLAYPTSRNWKDTSVRNAASKLMRQPKLTARLNEIRNLSAVENVFGKESIIGELQEIALAKISSKKITMKDKLRALDMTAKIFGLYESTDEEGSMESWQPLADLIRNAHEKENSEKGELKND